MILNRFATTTRFVILTASAMLFASCASKQANQTAQTDAAKTEETASFNREPAGIQAAVRVGGRLFDMLAMETDVAFKDVFVKASGKSVAEAEKLARDIRVNLGSLGHQDMSAELRAILEKDVSKFAAEDIKYLTKAVAESQAKFAEKPGTRAYKTAINNTIQGKFPLQGKPGSPEFKKSLAMRNEVIDRLNRSIDSKVIEAGTLAKILDGVKKDRFGDNPAVLFDTLQSMLVFHGKELNDGSVDLKALVRVLNEWDLEGLEGLAITYREASLARASSGINDPDAALRAALKKLGVENEKVESLLGCGRLK